MFVDRVLVTLAHLRHDLPHAALAVLLGVDRSTASTAIRQVRPRTRLSAAGAGTNTVAFTSVGGLRARVRRT
ncbi:transposase family protein [Streptomyces sp. NPDC048362]|uniref:transposase family protein n=1 Tax=Streptomyces sp. NPDC048362 TaxID=3365539 RepID=UPI00370F787C